MSATAAIVGAAVLVKAALLSALVVQHRRGKQAIANSPSLSPRTRLVAGAH